MRAIDTALVAYHFLIERKKYFAEFFAGRYF